MGRIEAIWIKRAHRGVMDPVASAVLVPSRGIRGNANQGGTRQVTLLSLERWLELMSEFSDSLPTSARRANIVVSGLDLAMGRGQVLRLGECRVRVLGETRPCERMDEALPGLQSAMRLRWGGGAYAEVLDEGTISAGETAMWEPDQT